jgi:hypothetical protein
MKESFESGPATHIGPESCGAAREGGVEALTGESAGRVFSRVRELLRDADAVRRCGRPHPVHRYREVYQSPARSETPCMYADTSLGNREIPSPPGAASRPQPLRIPAPMMPTRIFSIAMSIVTPMQR